jgi:hypothetical protein
MALLIISKQIACAVTCNTLLAIPACMYPVHPPRSEGIIKWFTAARQGTTPYTRNIARHAVRPASSPTRCDNSQHTACMRHTQQQALAGNKHHLDFNTSAQCHRGCRTVVCHTLCGTCKRTPTIQGESMPAGHLRQPSVTRSMQQALKHCHSRPCRMLHNCAIATPCSTGLATHPPLSSPAQPLPIAHTCTNATQPSAQSGNSLSQHSHGAYNIQGWGSPNHPKEPQGILRAARSCSQPDSTEAAAPTAALNGMFIAAHTHHHTTAKGPAGTAAEVPTTKLHLVSCTAADCLCHQQHNRNTASLLSTDSAQQRESNRTRPAAKNNTGTVLAHQHVSSNRNKPCSREAQQAALHNIA